MRHLVYLLLILTSLAHAADGPDLEAPEVIERARQQIERDFTDTLLPMMLSPAHKAQILSKYDHLDPRHEVPQDLLEDAVVFFDANSSRFPNQEYITIVDFKPRSDRYRFFLVHLRSGQVEKYRTTHGEGSDVNDDGYAERFGNEVNSGKSSLGFVRTAEVYYGRFDRSIRLDGLSSTNSRMRERAVVFHGWDGVREAPVIQKRSRGCITLDWSVKDGVLDKIKNGSLMYVGVSR